jgi:hypothetical protein
MISGKGCIYIHCYAHRLNLVVVDTARGIKEVDNFFDLRKPFIVSFQSLLLGMEDLPKHSRTRISG